ncbi:glycosyltransferase family 4 protein [Paraglaciecola aquimarina]|uniref:Glycosyltransferase family 4 protein n=1 Tax=Paraglaciecola algarum TaxID=3050085 RepID=A0ABS9D662_9ALTE|nr:glycosyltransferase family 4 protein [Paraglaciecola sp. G1-23]MCF2947927.1 glycosyltransferase family 4 protein [Paraglaciecola sp. G1-23]
MGLTDNLINAELNNILILSPNLKQRLSGVTTTVLRLTPVIAKKMQISVTGPAPLEDLPYIPLWKIPFLSRTHFRVWHARRNNEMILGLILRGIFRLKVKLLFTSAAQRDHKPFTKKLIAKMDEVIATSPQAATYLQRPAEVVMHGINCQLFKPAANPMELRQSLNLPEGLLIGCFGRIRHQKGQDLLIEAAARLLPTRPNIHIVFCGRTTPENQTYQDDLINKLKVVGLSDRVTFLGELHWHQVVQLYQSLDIFVAPARWEGFGLTPLEAMACGVPVIAGKDVGTFSEQIIHGETGMLCEKDNVQAMTFALQTLLDDPKRLTQLGKNARAHVKQHFSIEREAQALINIYKRLLS